jgi:pyruvate/2-oxoglutarate dehydrogenase complex dihydrolipoamide acyltransferase (E2) component
MTRITVPFLDANIVDVTVVKWRKAIGDAVSSGDVAVEISTDKAAFEIEAPASGTLLAVFAPEKSIVPIKFVLGLIGTAGEEDSAATADNAALMAAYRASLAAPAVSAAGPKPATAGASAAPATPATGASPALRATPKARRYAQSKGIDLAEVARTTGASMITEAIIMQYEEGLKK